MATIAHSINTLFPAHGSETDFQKETETGGETTGPGEGRGGGGASHHQQRIALQGHFVSLGSAQIPWCCMTQDLHRKTNQRCAHAGIFII